jgi:hypothetical protein
MKSGGSADPAEPTSAPPSTPEAWKKHIGEATALEQVADRNMVAAIRERGLRIAAFHAAEKQAKWFKSWDEACRDVVGLDQSTASMYERVGLTLIDVVNDVLPADVVSLCHLGNARAASKEFFDKTIEAGDIHPKMTRKDAKDIRDKARNEHWPLPPRPDPPPILAWLKSLGGEVNNKVWVWCKKQIKLRVAYKGADDPKLAYDTGIRLFSLIAKFYRYDFPMMFKMLADARKEHEKQNAAPDAEPKIAMAKEDISEIA